LIPSRGFFVCKPQTLALHGINGDSAGNYGFIDDESTGGMVMPPGIKGLRELPRNPPEEWDSAEK
jgi:hypothetical protein